MEKDYTKYSFLITMLVIVIMLGISLIPPFTVYGITFRRANIISSLYEFKDEGRAEKEAAITAIDEAFIKEMEKAEKQIQADTQHKDINSDEIQTDTWSIGSDTPTVNSDYLFDPSILNTGTLSEEEFNEKFSGVVPIEDFTPAGSPSVEYFCSLLGTESQKRVVRIGFIGDSFIEGDIITADIREQLQSRYGGRGVGFIPFSTPLAQNKPTIKHSYAGWSNYNLIQKKSAPADVQERFFISGTISTATATATSTYETTNFRKYLNSVNSVRLLYANTEDADIKLTINDTIDRKFPLEKSDDVQQIYVDGNGIKKLKATVSNPKGFYGYGVVLEGKNGISVDNYSIRSNSGLPMFGTNAAVNKRINRMLGYDMIVIQYGLNVMEENVTSYKNYGTQFRKMVNYIKNCFPNTVIVIMGIGDRSTMKNGVAVTMPGVKGMLAEQRETAIDCGVAFWNTFEAMGGENSMGKYVSNGWAAKDYTHLSFKGGEKIAAEFVRALEFNRETLGDGRQEEFLRLLGDSYYMIEVPQVENINTFENTEHQEKDSIKPIEEQPGIHIADNDEEPDSAKSDDIIIIYEESLPDDVIEEAAIHNEEEIENGKELNEESDRAEEDLNSEEEEESARSKRRKKRNKEGVSDEV